MSHLSDTGFTYFQHLIRSWRWAAMLFVHGLFPDIWKSAVSDEMCAGKNSTRAYMLKKMYNIDESNLND